MAVLRMVSKTIGREIVASYNRQFAPLVQALIGIGARIHFVNSKVSGEQCEIYCLRTTPQKCIAAVFMGTTKKQSIFPVTTPSHGYGFRLGCTVLCNGNSTHIFVKALVSNVTDTSTADYHS